MASEDEWTERAPSEAASYIEAHADRLRGEGSIQSEPVDRAFRTVPRHLFIPPAYYTGNFFGGEDDFSKVEYDVDTPEPSHLETIYSGDVLVTCLGDGLPTSSSSQSGLVAEMLELLRLDRGMRVLEIGAGTGFNAALLAELAGDQRLVTTVDNQPEVVARARAALTRAGYPDVRVVEADGFYGVPETGPYDRIVATVGCPDLSPHWVDQLASDGLMLVPFRHAGANPLLRVERDGTSAVGRFVGWSGFMPIRGELYDDSYYSPPVRSDEQEDEEVPLWPGLRDTEGGSSAGGFWFYVGLRDRRTHITRWNPLGFALVDDTGSVRIDEDRIVLNGDRALLDDLNALHDEWRQLGSPGVLDYSVRFVPANDTVPASNERQWSVKGLYHTRVFSLADR